MSSPEGLLFGQQTSYTPKNNSAMENQPFEYDIPPTENDEVLIFSGR